MAFGKGYLIGEKFAEAIKDTINRVRTRGHSQIQRLRAVPGSDYFDDDSHYLSKTTAAWSQGTSQTLTLWGGDPGSETAAAAATIDAYNYVANLPSGIWVVVGRANGGFYLASFDLTGLSGYSSSAQQVLGHDASGELVWLNTTNCT